MPSQIQSAQVLGLSNERTSLSSLDDQTIAVIKYNTERDGYASCRFIKDDWTPTLKDFTIDSLKSLRELHYLLGSVLLNFEANPAPETKQTTK